MTSGPSSRPGMTVGLDAERTTTNHQTVQAHQYIVPHHPDIARQVEYHGTTPPRPEETTT